MAEYIEREALLADIDSAMDNAGMWHVVGQTLNRYIKRQPAADVVEVVRCRDCKYISVPTERGNFLCGHKMLGLVRPDDFCSFGERMEGE